MSEAYEIGENDLPKMNTPQTLKAEELKTDVVTAVNEYGRVDVQRVNGTTGKLIYLTFQFNGVERKKFMTASETLLLSTVFGKDMRTWKGKPIKLFKDIAKNPQTNSMVAVVRMRPA